jgi:hypothetical protein
MGRETNIARRILYDSVEPFPASDMGITYARLIAVGSAGLANTRRTEIMMPKGKLTPEGEVIAAYGAAMVAAFQVLINCLEESDALLPGQFPDALGVYMEMVKNREGGVSDMTLAVLHDIRAATLD